MNTLEELLQQSDVVSLNMPLNEKTRGFFDEKCFDAMKPNSFLVNTARGAVIKDEAMFKALKSGKVCTSHIRSIHISYS